MVMFLHPLVRSLTSCLTAMVIITHFNSADTRGAIINILPNIGICWKIGGSKLLPCRMPINVYFYVCLKLKCT